MVASSLVISLAAKLVVSGVVGVYLGDISSLLGASGLAPTTVYRCLPSVGVALDGALSIFNAEWFIDQCLVSATIINEESKRGSDVKQIKMAIDTTSMISSVLQVTNDKKMARID